MTWQVGFRPEVERDMAEAVSWYESQQPGLGGKFVEEVIQIWDELVETPLLHCKRHPSKNIRWRYPKHFPYRVIYEVIESEQMVIVAAVLHAARHERHWLRRV
jgi:plasmid stabilization system protein ParE